MKVSNKTNTNAPVDMNTLTKKQISAFIRVKSLQALADMTEGLEVGQKITLEQLSDKTNGFLNTHSVAGYIKAKCTIRNVTEREVKKVKERITKKYVNAEDENDYIYKYETVKCYKVVR